MIIVTTFPPWAWDVYAKQAIESFIKFWPIPILVYSESPPPLSNDRVGVRPLDDIKERTDFLEFEGPEPPVGYEDHYMFAAKQFCHKVFAQIDALKDNDRVIWLDADVITHKRVPMEVVEFLTDSHVTFLGRDGNYTETGFIGFNKDRPWFVNFVTNYTWMYTKKRIYDLNFWTDCHAFDFAKKGRGHNLTPEGKGVDSVFEMSILGEYATHHKGNRKFSLGGVDAA